MTSTEGDLAFLRRVLILGLVIVLALFLWRVIEVLLLVFGAVLFATLLHAIADPIARRTPLPRGWALAGAGLVVLGLVGLTGWLFGSEIRTQLTELIDRLPAAWSAFEQRLGVDRLSQRLMEQVPSGGSILSGVAGLVMSVAGALANLLVILFGGLYLAAQPALYRDGLLRLVPASMRGRIGDAVDACGEALRLWLLGQLVAMTMVGLLTGLGLWAIGLPSALALGLLAGLAEFVPYVGPVLAAIPALLIALTVGPDMVIWTLVLFVAVQQFESYLITPLVERRMVAVPPALTVFAVIALGLVLGPLGLLFATPLTVMLFVAVKKLYIRDTLGEPAKVPGD